MRILFLLLLVPAVARADHPLWDVFCPPRLCLPLCCPDDYCSKPPLCLPPTFCPGGCDDYCFKPDPGLPEPFCPCGCDDYCQKPAPLVPCIPCAKCQSTDGCCPRSPCWWLSWAWWKTGLCHRR